MTYSDIIIPLGRSQFPKEENTWVDFQVQEFSEYLRMPGMQKEHLQGHMPSQNIHSVLICDEYHLPLISFSDEGSGCKQFAILAW